MFSKQPDMPEVQTMKSKGRQSVGSHTRFAIAFVIAILLPLLIEYGGHIFLSPPQLFDMHVFQNVMAKEKPKTAGKTTVSSQETGAKNYILYKKAMGAQTEAHHQAVKHYQTISFYIAVIGGFVCIVLGLLTSIGSLSAGFIFGGALSILMSYIGYWSVMSNLIQVISLSVAFFLIVILAIRKVAKEEMRS